MLRRASSALLLVVLAAPAAVAADATLSHGTVPARGRQEAILTVPAFGRYAITVASPQGTALQLVDRVAGPGALQGTIGKSDGRLDAFLDRGEYKVVAFAPEKGSGDAQLKVRGFTERNGADPPLLVELKAVETTLDDLEQRSWWVEVKERRRVILEAAGRNLADLRLWTNGSWLVDAEPTREVVTGQPGRPMLVCRLAAELDPGIYLVTAYGGASQPQAEETTEHPLHLRFGIPRLPAAGRRRFTMSPFGADRWLVPGAATYLRLELPEARAASLHVATDATHPFEASGSEASIAKNALVPVAELDLGSATTDRVVTVTAAPGQSFVLQQFDLGTPSPCGGRNWVLERPGKYWVSSVHSGDPTDSVDATAIVTRWKWSRPRTEVRPIEAQVVTLAPGRPWVRRANLLETANVFVRIEKTGKYEVVARGTEARFRIEPFFTYPPPNYARPDPRPSGATWDLDAGYYVLTAEPVKKGIIDVALHAAGERDPFGAAGAGGSERRTAAQFTEFKVESNRTYTVYLNQQPEVRSGLVLRPLPLDLREALPVTQRPGETLSVPFRAKEEGTLRAEGEDGRPIAVSIDGGPPLASPGVKPGLHRLEVRPVGAETVNYSIVLEPLRLQAGTALPALPDPSRATPPTLPVLSEKGPRFLDLEREANATFLLRAAAPALYRLQTTGLLATEGRLRTRTVTAFARASQNGVGRNFFIEQYLREGDYQITVATQGRSKGHLGLTLKRAELLDGGVLSEGGAARRALEPGEAVAYRFTVAEPGDYHVRSFGEDTTFRCRLEDDAGWPIEAPDIAADVTRHFEPGDYQIVSLPEPVATRRVTLFERVRRPLKQEGHGPHVLPVAERVEHAWTEPEAGQPRVPDGWLITIPAPVNARIDLTGEMQGDLVGLDGGETSGPVVTVPPLRGWKGKLAAGRYRLDVTSARPNNHAPYALAVWPEELVAGLDREVSAPVSVPLAVGREGIVQLASFGSADVRARLYDAQDHLLAANDDGADDWNFQLQTRLGAGVYHLQVDPVGRSSATTVVSMRAPEESVEAPLGLPARTDTPLEGGVRVMPLQVPADRELLLVAARAPESLGCALEADGRTIGTSVGRTVRLEVPLAHGSQYRVRLWSVDGRPTRAHVTAVALAPPHTSELQLGRGVTVAPAQGIDPAVGVTTVALDHPGVFRIGEGTRACSAPNVPCVEPSNGTVAATGALLWLVHDLARDAKKTIRGSRVVLRPGAGRQVRIDVEGERPIACDVAASRGPLLAIATSLEEQPGVLLAARGASLAPSAADTGMAVGPRSAASVALSTAPSIALVWTGSAAGTRSQVTLRRWSFPAADTPSLLVGDVDGALGGIATRAFELPPGVKRVRLALGEATVAAFLDATRVASVHWHGDEAFEETLDTTASRLVVLHARQAPDAFHIELLPLGAAAPVAPLAAGTPNESGDVRAGTARLAVAPAASNAGQPRSLHVRGAASEATMVGADGRVTRGTDIPLGREGGTLLIRHDPGLVLAWIDRPGEEAADLFGSAAFPATTPLLPPAVVPLAGRAQALAVKLSGPAMLHLRTPTPVVTFLRRGETTPEVAVDTAGAALDAYVEGEPVVLALRAVGGGTLSGAAEVTTSPVKPIGEGLGGEVLLPAGGSALFSFTVTREGPVGIGVRATPDSVSCALLDARGKTLGTGLLQMPTLTPGTYLVALHAPPEVGPVTVRPALAGLDLPGTGPPADVVRSYLTMAGALPR
jgi:hypothetical protein